MKRMMNGMNAWPKVAIAMLTCVVLVCGMMILPGCASNEPSATLSQSVTPEESDVADIEIYDLGYSQDEEGNVSYSFIAVNPNANYIANSVMFSIEGYDAQGRMVLGTAEDAEVLYPLLPTAFSGTTYVTDPSVEIDTFVVNPSSESVAWSTADDIYAALPDMFEFSNVGNSRSTEGDAVVRGVVLINDPEALAQIEGVSQNDLKVNIAVVLANTEGDLVAGGTVEGVEVDAIQTVEDDSGETIEIPTASFSVSIPNAPAFKEAICFATPVVS